MLLPTRQCFNLVSKPLHASTHTPLERRHGHEGSYLEYVSCQCNAMLRRWQGDARALGDDEATVVELRTYTTSVSKAGHGAGIVNHAVVTGRRGRRQTLWPTERARCRGLGRRWSLICTLGLIPAAGSDERSTPLNGLFFTVGCGMLSSG